MVNIVGSVSRAVSRLAARVGLRPSRAERLRKPRERLRMARADNVEQLEMLKAEIQALEARALAKRKEFEAARGEVRRIVLGELEHTFRALGRLRGKKRILESNIERLSVALAKVDELEAAELHGVDEDELDDLSVELEVALDDLRRSDRATTELRQVEYGTPAADPADAEPRVAEIGRDTEEPPAELPEPMQARLREIEAG